MSHAIDMHCDTLMLAMFRDGAEADVFSRPDPHLDVKRLVEGGAMAQFFAIFIPPQGVYKHFGIPELTPEQYINGCAKIFRNTIERHSDVLAEAKNADDIERNFKNGKVSAVLTMEDGVEVHGDMAKLDHFYDMGVRARTLAWNFENCFGAPNSKDPAIMNKGLTEFGKEAVKHMQDIGMLVDVSHVSDGVFWDVYKQAKVPFVATHSNCRNLSPHQRNLSDEQLRKLADCGGITGINFAPAFLNSDIARTDSRAELMAVHARHMADVAGVDVIALGSDLDGIRGDLEVGSSDKFGLIEDALKRHGFTSDEIEKIFWKNAIRVMKETL